MSPFFVKHKVEAIRSLSQVVKDSNTNLGQYPNDFSLHHVGNFDTDTGEVTPIAKVEHGVIEISSLLETP